MGFLLSQKDQVLNPSFLFPGFSRSADPVDRSWSRSTRSVDRRAQTCTPLCTGGPVDLPGRPPESFCSLENPGRPDRSTDRETALCSSGSVDRAGRPKPQRSDFWPLAVDRAVDRQLWQTPTASFSSSIKWGIWGLFWLRFWESFQASFSYPFKRFSPLVLEQIFSIKRRVYQEC